MDQSGLSSDVEVDLDLDLEYDAWFARVEATYAAVSFCCFHRLNDRDLADRVGLRVVAGLAARPTIFRFTGLPFSGRIGALAERWIVEARAGRLGDDGDWISLERALRAVPKAERDILVLSCVRGEDDVAVGYRLRCNPASVPERVASTLRFFDQLMMKLLPGERALGRIIEAAQA